VGAPRLRAGAVRRGSRLPTAALRPTAPRARHKPRGRPARPAPKLAPGWPQAARHPLTSPPPAPRPPPSNPAPPRPRASSHVNFISGQNGSGKSAVLQALQICLGATARETGRGRSLRELIRTGCDEARLAVTLWNTGGDAYRPDELGDWVTIERVIKVPLGDAAAARGGGGGGGRGGGGGGGAVSTTWKVSCQRRGHLPKAGRRDLIDPMLDHLNIAAENPLCVMTQARRRRRGERAARARRGGRAWRVWADAEARRGHAQPR
jgi:hypothetical protein